MTGGTRFIRLNYYNQPGTTTFIECLKHDLYVYNCGVILNTATTRNYILITAIKKDDYKNNIFFLVYKDL